MRANSLLTFVSVLVIGAALWCLGADAADPPPVDTCDSKCRMRQDFYLRGVWFDNGTNDGIVVTGKIHLDKKDCFGCTMSASAFSACKPVEADAGTAGTCRVPAGGEDTNNKVYKATGGTTVCSFPGNAQTTSTVETTANTPDANFDPLLIIKQECVIVKGDPNPTPGGE